MRAQLCDQALALWTFQRIGHAVDQVVVGLQPVLLLEKCQPLPCFIANRMQQQDGLRPAPCGKRNLQLDMVGNQRLQCRNRGLACVRLVGPGVECLQGEPAEAFVQLKLRVGLLRPLLQLLAQCFDPVGLVRGFVEHATGDGHQQGVEIFLAMQTDTGSQRLRHRNATWAWIFKFVFSRYGKQWQRTGQNGQRLRQRLG